MTRYKMVNGEKIQFTAEEETAKDLEEQAWIIEKEKIDKTKYQRDRALKYPAIADQLDMIYHAGVGGDAFQAAIKAIKDKHPKE